MKFKFRQATQNDLARMWEIIQQAIAQDENPEKKKSFLIAQ
jgi:hypothetical protein